jgi:hypothetical protein
MSGTIDSSLRRIVFIFMAGLFFETLIWLNRKKSTRRFSKINLESEILSRKQLQK